MAAGLRLPPHQRPKRKSVSFLPRLFRLQGALFLLYTFSETLLWARFTKRREAPGRRSGIPDPAVSPAAEPSTCSPDVSLGRSLSGYTTRPESGCQDSRASANHSRGPAFLRRSDVRFIIHCFLRSFPQRPFRPTWLLPGSQGRGARPPPPARPGPAADPAGGAGSAQTGGQRLVQQQGRAGKGAGVQGRVDNQGLPGGGP